MKGIIIYETEHFVLYAPEHAHVPREDGGHLCVTSREKYFSSRADLSPEEAVEVMRLTKLSGEAMIAGMKERGVEIARINYQENGNWAFLTGSRPYFHIHLYGRTVDSKSQKWGEALVFPDPKTDFYDGFTAITEEDCAAIREKAEALAASEPYDPARWHL